MESSRIQPIDAFCSNQDAESSVDDARDDRAAITIAPIVPSSGSIVPSKRGGATLTQVGHGSVYLVGGANREATSFDDVHAFDLAAKTWQLLVSSRGSLPARSGHSTVAVGSALVVFGGLNARDGLVYNDIHVFDTVTRTWTEVAAEGEAPTPRNAHAAVLLTPADHAAGGRRRHVMLVFGGSSPLHGAFDDAFLLHLDAADAADGGSGRRKFRWEKLSCSGEQPEARELHCGVRVSDASVCFTGGRNRHGSMCTDMAYLDTTTWAWQVVPMCGWARCSHAAGLVDGVLTSLGGFDGARVCGDCWQFCDRADAWRPVRASRSVHERFGHCSATVVIPASVDGACAGSGGGKTAEESGNNAGLRPESALLVFGGMNAQSDLNDLVIVKQQR